MVLIVRISDRVPELRQRSRPVEWSARRRIASVIQIRLALIKTLRSASRTVHTVSGSGSETASQLAPTTLGAMLATVRWWSDLDRQNCPPRIGGLTHIPCSSECPFACASETSPPVNLTLIHPWMIRGRSVRGMHVLSLWCFDRQRWLNVQRTSSAVGPGKPFYRTSLLAMAKVACGPVELWGTDKWQFRPHHEITAGRDADKHRRCARIARGSIL